MPLKINIIKWLCAVCRRMFDEHCECALHELHAHDIDGHLLTVQPMDTFTETQLVDALIARMGNPQALVDRLQSMAVSRTTSDKLDRDAVTRSSMSPALNVKTERHRHQSGLSDMSTRLTSLKTTYSEHTKQQATGGRRAMMKHVSSIDAAYRPATCPYCSARIAQRANLRRHIRLKHSTSIANKPTFACSMCTNTYTAKQALKRHVQTVHAAECADLAVP
jgi:hypothetical protein